MNKIVFPLKPGMQGTTVVDLQDALHQCLERGILVGVEDKKARHKWTVALQKERARKTYHDATKQLVAWFQEARGLRGTRGVDEATANALNALLKEWNLLDRPPTPKVYVVSGTVRREDDLLLHAMRVQALHESEHGAIRLGEDTTDAEGRYTIRYELLPAADGIHLRVSAIGADGTRPQVSDVIRNAKPLETIDLTVPIVAAPSDRRRIEGTIVLEHGLPAENLKLRLYRRDFGGKATLLNEGHSLAGGRYAFAYDVDSASASLEVRAVKADGSEVALSKPLNELTPEARASLNLIAPGSLQPLASEYRRLAGDLTRQVGQLTKLAAAMETGEQQDITVLNRATGWDARLIALASVTERLAADRDVKDAGLDSEALYGLLRAGLPSDKLLLAQVEPDVVDMALEKVRDAGIVNVTDADIAEFQTKFEGFANKTRLAVPVPGSRSTYSELLRSSGLPPKAQDTFASIYLKHRGTGEQLWEDARKAGLEAQVGTLQLQGKLAFLAGTSEAMTTRLLNKEGLKDPVDLVGQDFHHASAWKKELFNQADVPQDRRANLSEADRKKLEAVIPTVYAGANVETRLEAYVEDMARKVRLSYPTQVLGRLLETDEKFKLSSGHDPTVKLLKGATAEGFRLGETPVSAFLRSHAGVSGDLSDADFQVAGQQLKALQRV